MTDERVSDEQLWGPPSGGGNADGSCPNSVLKDGFIDSSADSETEEPLDFQWSTQRYRVHQLVQQFCENTKSNF